MTDEVVSYRFSGKIFTAQEVALIREVIGLINATAGAPSGSWSTR